MTLRDHINAENDLLVSELGSNPRYAWKNSRMLYVSVQEIKTSATSSNGIEPQYEYKANPKTGLIELSPKYIQMRMLPALPDNWLLCKFVAADQEWIFRQRFGNRIEYPADGIWQPWQFTALREGVIPSRADTWNMIRGVKANTVAVRELFDYAEANQDKQETADENKIRDLVKDRMTAFMEVPGKKGGTSFPSHAKTIKENVCQPQLSTQ